MWPTNKTLTLNKVQWKNYTETLNFQQKKKKKYKVKKM